MVRARMTTAAVVAVVLALASISAPAVPVGAVPGPASAREPGVYPSSDVLELHTRAARAQEAATEIQEWMRANRAESFSGIELADEASRIVVYATANDPRAVEAIEAIAKGIPTTIELSPASERTLQGKHQEIRDSLSDLLDQGHRIVYFWPEPRTGQEVVQVYGSSSETRAQLAQRLGPVARVEPTSMAALPTTGSRISDSAPWSGGTFMNAGTKNCTAGIPVHNAALQTFLITAAHCFAQGATVRNYASGIPLGSPVNIGTVFSRDLIPYGNDAEIVSTTAGSYTYIGATSTSTKAAFKGAVPTLPGSPVCANGAYEGEHCGGTVYSTGGCAYVSPGRWACNLTYVYSSDQQSVGPGDSGGPVQQWQWNWRGGLLHLDLMAAGILTAMDANFETTCANWTQLGRKCSSHYWFTDIIGPMSTWGLTVNSL